MRVGFITTGTNDTDHVIDSARCVPQFKDIFITVHDPRLNHANDREDKFELWVRANKLDVVFYIGGAHGNNPTIEQFKYISAPRYHICFDAGDQPWWPLLQEYKNHSVFLKQITIDGAKNSPCDLATLTPINPDLFQWQQKKIHHLGFCGSNGSQMRRNIIYKLIKNGTLTFKNRDKTNYTYTGYMDFMCKCQQVLNMSWTGSGKTHHVKGRVIETILAGARLLEFGGSPTSDYFEQGVDYLVHNNNYQSVIRAADEPPWHPQKLRYIRDKAIDLYGPKAFYKLLLGAILP